MYKAKEKVYNNVLKSVQILYLKSYKINTIPINLENSKVSHLTGYYSTLLITKSWEKEERVLH